MRIILSVCLLVALSPVMEAQQPGPPGSGSALQQYLELTAAQMDALRRANIEFEAWVEALFDRAMLLEEEIDAETKKESPDPLAIGQRVVEIVRLSREMDAKMAETIKSNVALLTDPQKARLKVLEDALRLVPLAYQAAYMGLLAYPEEEGFPPAGPVRSRIRLPRLVK